MKMSIVRAGVVLAGFISGLFGCAHLQTDVVMLERLDNCERHSVEEQLRRLHDVRPVTDTFDLRCLLGFLRENSDPALRESVFGTKVCLMLAERSSEGPVREKFAAEGIRFAEEAIRLGADADGKVHYYLALNLGLAVRDHVTLAIENLGRLSNELKTASKLSPAEDDGGPDRVLGMLYLKAPPWPKGIGDGDKALELLKKVVDEHPSHPLNHLFYAQALWELQEEDAREEVRQHLAMGRKLIEEGPWGFNKESWNKEFSEIEKDIGN
jgi:hypothetical protein